MSARDYFRGDQRNGVSAPNLAKKCPWQDRVVHARGKRTAYTSISLEAGAIEIFGEAVYILLREKIIAESHDLIEHETLLAYLVDLARSGEKAERAKALVAIRYTRSRKEGLVDWNFDISKIQAKDLMSWAYTQVQPFFKVR